MKKIKIAYIGTKRQYDYFTKYVISGNIEWILVEYDINETIALHSLRGITIDGYIVDEDVKNGLSIHKIISGVISRIK